MSDNPNGQADPVIEHLRERSRILLDEIADRRARLDEINAILTALAAPSRVNRKRKNSGTSTALAPYEVRTIRADPERDVESAPEDTGAAGAE